MTELAVIVTARNEADRIGATLRALAEAFPGAVLWVADDASVDGTAAVAARAGARVVSSAERLGKGGAATLAARAMLAEGDPFVVLADADLGESARSLPLLLDALGERDNLSAMRAKSASHGGERDIGGAIRTQSRSHADLAIATFARRVGGGFGLAVGTARWAIRRSTGRTMAAPISGQRAMRPGVLSQLLPFATGFGMETGMTIDALKAGLTVTEVELDLEHRATGRTLGGFMHRAKQARDIVRAYASRRK